MSARGAYRLLCGGVRPYGLLRGGDQRVLVTGGSGGSGGARLVPCREGRTAAQDIRVGLRVGTREGDRRGGSDDRGGRGDRDGGRGREQRPGQDHHGRGAALLLLPQLYAHTVPVGEARHHVQTEPESLSALLVVGVLRIELGETGVELGHPVGGHADALVLHGEHHLAALQQPAGDLDGQVGRRERRGVLQEFGHQVREVVRGEPGEVRVRRQDGDTDALVPLDLADRGAYDVDERDGARVVLDVFVTGEDEQVLAVAPHDGGEVVQLEERAEAVRVLFALLQALDDPELPLDQTEGAQREVDEGAVDGAAHLLQMGGRVGEFRAQLVALVGHHLALPDEVLAVRLEW